MRSIVWKAVFVLHAFILAWFLSSSGLAAPGAAAEIGPAGSWSGFVDILQQRLAMTVHLDRADDASWAGTIDVPQQGAHAVPLKNVVVDGDAVTFELAGGIGVATFDGTHDAEKISGTFSQGGYEGTFTFARIEDEAEAAPDTGTATNAYAADPDAPYTTEERTLTRDGIRLAGTLTLPKGEGPFPLVVFSTGSGPQDRDETLFGFKPFRILADAFARKGVASLRYDDRGVGGSTGSIQEATTRTFADDVAMWIESLRPEDAIDAARAGVLGHSEGGAVAAIAAAADPSLAFIVSLAGPATPGEQVLRDQARAGILAEGGSEAIFPAVDAQQDLLFGAIRTGEGIETIEFQLKMKHGAAYMQLPAKAKEAIASKQDWIDAAAKQELDYLRSSWYRGFLDSDSGEDWKKVRCPALALFGEFDTQVLPEPNVARLKSVLPDGHRTTIETIPGVNHLFQPSATGAVSEYATLPPAFAAGVVERIVDWTVDVTSNEAPAAAAEDAGHP